MPASPAPPTPENAPGSAPAVDPLLAGSWCLRRRVLPQHTDHAGVMWHGAYVAWLEEARVEALAAVGLAYSDLAARGLELPVVSLAIDYRQALRHGDRVEIRSQALPRRGLKLPWRSLLLNGAGGVAAEARVDLVAVPWRVRAGRPGCCAGCLRTWSGRWPPWWPGLCHDTDVLMADGWGLVAGPSAGWTLLMGAVHGGSADGPFSCVRW